MSPPKSTLSLDLASDIVFGSIGAAIPPSERLDHAARYFGTWSGSDKLMMTAQYGVKLLAQSLQIRSRTQYRAGKRLTPVSSTTEGLYKFAAQLSVARRVSGFWGLLAVLKAISALERSPPASRTRLNLQRLQGLAMLVFYPLEYISFFSSPLAPVLRSVSPSTSAKAQIWSIRAWGAYVGLHILLLRNEWNDLVRKECISESRIEDVKVSRDADTIKKRKQAIIYQLVADISRLPVILHWSVVGGIYKSDALTNILSFISALAAFLGGWESTRLPAPSR